MLCSGRCLWKDCAAPQTPSSAWKRCCIALAAAIIAGFRMDLKAAASLLESSSSAGRGSGPTPARLMAQPQNGWSPKNVTHRVGLPAESPATTVPAPPWWTTPLHWAKSQSWGAAPMQRIRCFMRSSARVMVDQLLWRTAYSSASTAASASFCVNVSGLGRIQDPNPTKTGPSPPFFRRASSRNRTSSGGGAHPGMPLPGRTRFPTTSAWSGHSGGLGTRAGLHMKAKGTSLMA
mmetsp:Transcript_70499/g.187770  ORF Transcript_70499/g.187770 Transcript_70499/m.187770 type:complete len:234 (+) Transcript_70499:1176-1877(+)